MKRRSICVQDTAKTIRPNYGQICALIETEIIGVQVGVMLAMISGLDEAISSSYQKHTMPFSAFPRGLGKGQSTARGTIE